MYLNMVKARYDKLAVSIPLNGEMLKALPLRSGTEQRYLCLPFLFNIVQGVVAKEISQSKERKGLQIRKEEVKLSLCKDDMIVYKEYLNVRINKPTQLIFRIQKSTYKAFLYTANKLSGEKNKKTISIPIDLNLRPETVKHRKMFLDIGISSKSKNK